MTRCGSCPNVNTCIPPDGPLSSDVLLIGEAPGKDEQRRGRVFVGKTGQELDGHYLPLAGLRRSEVLITNAVACLPTSTGGKIDPKRPRDLELLESCAYAHLYPLIESGRFRLLVPMGAFACRVICPDAQLDLQHGFPVNTPWGIPAFPLYHPAMGIHEPKKMLMIRNDWIRLKSYRAGKLTTPIDELETDYAEVTDVHELASLDPTLPLAADTESSRSIGPYCLTYSQEPSVGRLIRASRTDLLDAFNARLRRWKSIILFHNWLYDRKVCLEMGVQFPDSLIRDTMLMAFHLGNLPQGLKALGWREAGMQMQDFDDLVRPYSAEVVLYYYQQAQMREWPKPEQRMELDEKSGLWKLKKPQGMNTKLKRFFTDYSKNPEKDVFSMWDKNWTEEQGMLEAELGPWPGLDIAHAPFPEVLHYACRDPDATLRLYPILRAMQRQVRRRPQEQWRDVA